MRSFSEVLFYFAIVLECPFTAFSRLFQRSGLPIVLLSFCYGAYIAIIFNLKTGEK